MSNSYFQVSQKAIVHDLDQDTILLVRKSSDSNYAGCWELPGGRMENGEDFDASLEREVHEETGVRVRAVPGEPTYLWQWRWEQRFVIGMVRYAWPLGKEIDLSGHTPGDFISEVAWVSRKEARDLAWIPNYLPWIRKFL